MVRGGENLRILVVGSSNFDLVAKADRLPREGEVVVARDLRFFHGGKGANRAVAVARLGAATTFISAVGNDVIGDFVIEGLRQNGVETGWLKRAPDRSTGCSWITLLPSGNNATLVEPAANFSLTAADIERAGNAIAECDAVSADLEVPLEAVGAALERGRKAGKLTVLDAGPPRCCPAEILRLADVVSPNEPELEALTAMPVSDRGSARDAARKLIGLGVRTVVVKLGSDGSMLVTSQTSKHFPAPRIETVDPTGAGDAFTAALTVQLALGVEIEDAIRYANFAGALAATKLGAQPSMPTREELEAFAAHNAARQQER